MTPEEQISEGIRLLVAGLIGAAWVALPDQPTPLPAAERPASPDSPWMLVAEVQDYARIGQRELLAALADGSLRGHQNKPGGRWRIHRDDVDAWLRDVRIDPDLLPVTRRRRI